MLLSTGSCFGLLAYFFVTRGHLVASLVVGTLGGIGFTLATHSQLRRVRAGLMPDYGTATRGGRTISLLFRAGLLVMGGVGIMAGAGKGSASTIVTGALLVLLSVTLGYARRRRDA